MSRILVVDDQAIVRDPIAATLRSVGYDAICAIDGRGALALISSATPDLVILDVSMPGMTGLDVLEAMRRLPACAATPVILLTASADKDTILRAASFGVRDYLLKSRFSLPELLARVAKYLGPPSTAAPPQNLNPQSSGASTVAPKVGGFNAVPESGVVTKVAIPQLMTRDECLKRAGAAMEARSLSGVAAQVISLAASPRGDLDQLASLIGRDPALSARVLQAANSAAFASKRGPVTNIPDAVRQVGCATVRGIASTVGIYEAMSVGSDASFNPIRSWQHSFAVAILCEQLCLSAQPELGGTAYLVGLCHDLGEILFRTHFADQYQQVLAAHAQSGQSLVSVERQMLGMPHGELVRTIIRKMGLPDVIRLAIETFHGEDAQSSTDPLVRILLVAEAYANGLGLASSGASTIRPLTRNECRAATGMELPVTSDDEQFRAEIYALTSMLARLSAADEKRLMVPLHQRRDTRVWLAREGGFSAFDPIAAALQVFGNLSVHDRLPRSKEELADHVLLVVVTRTPAVAGFMCGEIDQAAGSGPQRLPVLWLCTRPSASPAGSLTPVPATITLDAIANLVVRAGALRSVAA